MSLETEFGHKLAHIGLNQTEVAQFGLMNAIEASLWRNRCEEELPLHHQFIDGFYVRTIRMPKGSLVISKTHDTWHPFVITNGHGIVMEEIEGKITKQYEYIAFGEGEHFTCLSEPGTRRLIYCMEDTVWTTFHPTGVKTPEEFEAKYIRPNTNPLLR